MKDSSSRDAPRVSAEQVAAFRVARHHLDTPLPVASLARVAGDMCGAQAQVMSAAQLSLRARIRGLRAEDVEKALWKDRTLAKVACMRGTLHLVPSRDHGVFVRGCARRGERLTGWIRRRGLPMDVIDRMVDAVGQALDRPLTREELAKRVAASLGTHKRVRRERGWGNAGPVDVLEVDGTTVSVGGILHIASMRGLACFGPDTEAGPTYVRPDRWIPDLAEMPFDEAGSELLRRYLRAFGPATVRDFALWTYITAGAAREVWDRVQPEMAPVQVDGRLGSMLRKDLPVLRRAGIDRPTVRLLPYFDGFLLGHKDKGHLVDARHYKRVYRPAGWLAPVVLVDGRVTGVWSYKRKGDRLLTNVEPFQRLTRAVREGVEAEADDVARFFGARLELRIR